MASAWSPALRASVLQHFAGSPEIGYPVGELDSFAARWITAYGSTCPTRARPFAKLACWLGKRDQVAAFADLLPTLPRDLLGADMASALPRLEAGDHEDPVAPPPMLARVCCEGAV